MRIVFRTMVIKAVIKLHNLRALNELAKKNRGFGMNELLGIAAALILAAFIIIPGLRTFATGVMTRLSEWWKNSVTGVVFPT